MWIIKDEAELTEESYGSPLIAKGKNTILLQVTTEGRPTWKFAGNCGILAGELAPVLLSYKKVWLEYRQLISASSFSQYIDNYWQIVFEPARWVGLNTYYLRLWEEV
ncbi:hypothetical protein [Okeania sp. SIO2B3]|uniref:hypothetical protein n=1 Tax=Okeania sp. SIO2B3 TaxID=2607784 RepID=UPI0013BFC138|nr:hypothetical protein [Okeania sp. SIO2B3]NET40615.1 hypothetical protein [Okeania sp. SIO2B3]